MRWAPTLVLVSALALPVCPAVADPDPAAAPAPAAPTAQSPKPRSLMFSDADLSAVAKAQAAAERVAAGMPLPQTPQAENEPLPPGVPNVYVSAIMDMGDGDWTVWANGYRITPKQQAPDFTVLGVKNNAVEIAVAGDQPARFRLHPYQTWRSAHHDIVEGIFP